MILRKYGHRHAALLVLAALIALEQIVLPRGHAQHVGNVAAFVLVAGFAAYLVIRRVVGRGWLGR
jgi:hypothetical protein